MPTEQTNIVPGSIVEGKVQGITSFGAFIELSGGTVGLVHISEIADTYVKDVRDFLQEGDPVKVKVLNVAGKKIGLSIKQANPTTAPEKPARPAPQYNDRLSGNFAANNRPRPNSREGQGNLDDMIAKFLKESDERLQPLKNRMEPRRRPRGN
ncbi:MAG TPA: S1 RNA-binding domain-containing protein [Syntrophomonadaceae bacterium]|nr:S1 RNA-binding domain-containing protein [Syntrophomonadaceae bacterium]HQE23094.1 S1 RNA-binding domain-containing protein [Syntrophomonadaceae bacterium]